MQATETSVFQTTVIPMNKMVVLPPPPEEKSTRRAMERTKIILRGNSFNTTPRFWSSFGSRFGVSPNIFHLFNYDEVFQRIADRNPDCPVRVVTETCVDEAGNRQNHLLGMTNPDRPIVEYDRLMNILDREQGAISADYSNGCVFSKHELGHEFGMLDISGEKYRPMLCLKTPIDGWGLPSIYLELLRMVCANGMVAMSRAFKSDIQLGRDSRDSDEAIVRTLQSFSNDEGFAAFRERVEKAERSWASISEVKSLERIIHKIYPTTGTTGLNGKIVRTPKEERAKVVRDKFNEMTGSMIEIYGLAQLESLSERKSQTLPTKATVNDLINFSTEVATHQTRSVSARYSLQMWFGNMICREFDLENSRDQIKDFADFFFTKPVK